MKRKFLRKFLEILGVILILIGIVGLFLPLIQGVALIVLGALLLGEESKIGKKILSKIKRGKRI